MPSGAVQFDPVTGVYYDALTGQIVDDGSGSSAGQLVGDLFGDEGGDQSGASGNSDQGNLQAAAVQAAAGLPAERSSWTGQDAAEYVTRFRAIILQNPDSFAPLSVQVAQNMNLGRIEDWQRYDQTKPIDPQLILVGITNMMNDSVELLRPVSQFPAALTNAANGLLAAANNLGKGLQNTGAISGLLQIALPIGLVLWGLGMAAGPIKATKSIFR
jgi:hypothetical protein